MGIWDDAMYPKKEHRTELKHYGVQGMKWGVRRYQPYQKGDGQKGKGKFLGEKIPKSKSKAPVKKIAKKSGTLNFLPTSKKIINKNKENITLTEDPQGRLAKVIGRISKKSAEQQEKTSNIAMRNDEGKKVGSIQIHKESPEELNLVWMDVAKSEQGKGTATTALKSVINDAAKQGFSKVTLEVPGSSPDAKHIYKKLGFKEKGSLSTDDVWGGLTEMELTIPKNNKLKHSRGRTKVIRVRK